MGVSLIPTVNSGEAINESPLVIDGRLCAGEGEIACCLPCPSTDWLYPDSFQTVNQAADWVNVAGLIACGFLLLSFAVLPVEKTHRHYLSICLVLAVVLMHLGFVTPLAAKPDECFDHITPNGMESNLVCAFSGAFIVGGGWAGVMWVFLRALALHLQICWQVVMGKSCKSRSCHINDFLGLTRHSHVGGYSGRMGCPFDWTRSCYGFQWGFLQIWQ